MIIGSQHWSALQPGSLRNVSFCGTLLGFVVLLCLCLKWISLAWVVVILCVWCVCRHVCLTVVWWYQLKLTCHSVMFSLVFSVFFSFLSIFTSLCCFSFQVLTVQTPLPLSLFPSFSRYTRITLPSFSRSLHVKQAHQQQRITILFQAYLMSIGDVFNNAWFQYCDIRIQLG